RDHKNLEILKVQAEERIVYHNNNIEKLEGSISTISSSFTSIPRYTIRGKRCNLDLRYHTHGTNKCYDNSITRTSNYSRRKATLEKAKRKLTVERKSLQKQQKELQSIVAQLSKFR
ncbi:MAG: hypothetical protein NE330_07550, partial [Lentisphaeraceae bacterium]|nr:hypothetical protein [Lentisphaeraceae bacterium]